ncbi:hypothetical protein NUU61_010100 [Penicillium alfredii]|uniref:2EXR domain-containing protein n=1 Tax=Penicillium alfredii TaxID=1506179 RepID=A0A9W9EHI6_9EURO|nr:uncharacterized protein NUU61_010100 [Penicillium alfredii]KAJ5081836.1 hypothetical protein NUU61_010100 [Penicillium alfredii]
MATVFNLFPSLPTEIRLLIWRACLPSRFQPTIMFNHCLLDCNVSYVNDTCHRFMYLIRSTNPTAYSV